MGLFDRLQQNRTTGAYNASAAFKRATALKLAGDHSGAADVLEEAIEHLENNPPFDRESNTPKQFPELRDYLRLGMYLQAASKNDEAWALFNRLLIGDYPAWQQEDEFWRSAPAVGDIGVQTASLRRAASWAGTQGQIYEKMRLFLQREGRHLHAVRSGLLAIGAPAQQTALQMEEERGTSSFRMFQTALSDQCAEDFVRERVQKLTKKAKVERLEDGLVAATSEWMSSLPEARLEDLSESLSKILGENAASSE